VVLWSVSRFTVALNCRCPCYASLFFSLTRPPPRSTLFPYTTLFRSRLTLTSRAFHNDRLAEFAERLTALTGLDMVLPMNTGAEAVESAVKVARKWAYDVKGVPADRATIVVAADNFHGRTTTIVSFSTDEVARRGFGPFTPGFRVVPYNDLAALEEAV